MRGCGLAVLEFKKVSKTFYTGSGETKAVSSLSFSVDKGEFVALLGPSGCGKTTILSLACGLIKACEGEILINGAPASASCSVGYMLQRDHLFEWRNIYKNVLLGLEVRKMLTEENISHAKSLIDKYGLADFYNYFPTQLSGGMRQRVALIRTLATNPEILLLDEPFSALDYQTRLKLCDDVYSIIKKENKTTLLVTHDISEAISMADRIIILSARPCNVKRIHYTDLKHISTPLKRREAVDFGRQFDSIWQDLNQEEQNEDYQTEKQIQKEIQ